MNKRRRIASAWTAPELLEARIAPARVFALGADNLLFSFNSDSPETVRTSVTITGLAGGATERLDAIDFRPATGELYALGVVDQMGATDDVRLYKVNTQTGVASQVGSGSVALEGSSRFAIDFNPTVDRLRVVNSAGDNARLNPDTGARVDTAPEDTNLTIGVESVAYANNFQGAGQTTLFGIDFSTDDLVRIGGVNGAPSPNLGQVTAVGDLGISSNSLLIGFDIQTTTAGDIGWASVFTNLNGYRLYNANLSTGLLTPVGAIGSGLEAVRDIAVPVPVMRIINATTATYVDADGDVVTIKTNKGTFDQGDFTILSPAEGNVPGGGLLRAVSIGDDELSPGVKAFAGAALSFTAVRGPLGGDGLMSVANINAAGVNLAAVTVDGDLGGLIAGSGQVNGVTPVAVGSLTVHSLGLLEPGANAVSLAGNLTKLQVKTDLAGTVTVETYARLGSATIGGSVIGSAANSSGRISAGEIGTVKIAGDLRAGAGDESGKIVATVRSIGSVSIGRSMFGAVDVVTDTNGQIDAAMSIGTLSIGRDVVGFDSSRSGQIQVGTTVGSIKIGGSLLGGNGLYSASIMAGGDIGSISIRGDVRSSTGDESAKIYSGEDIGSLTIGGSVIGAAGDFDAEPLEVGQVHADSIKKLSVKLDVIGADGSRSGWINAAIGTGTIGGSIIGSSGASSGRVSGDSIGSLTVMGNVIGGSTSSSGSISATEIGVLKIAGSVIGGSAPNAGQVFVNGRLNSLTIGGDLRAGLGVNLNVTGAVIATSAGSITIGGDVVAPTDPLVDAPGVMIGVTNELTSLTIKGDIIGNDAHAAIVFAGGATTPNVTKNLDVAFGKITVMGHVHRANILAGYTDYFSPTPTNADAQIGSVLVKGNWTASNLVAGSTTGGDGRYGTGDETLAPGDDAGLTARIASITIGGRVSGTLATGDHYGFVAAGTIGLLKVNGSIFKPAATPGQVIEGIGSTGDVSLVTFI